jgi:hypothetical protein
VNTIRIHLCLAVAIAAATMAYTQMPAYSNPGPIPPAILNAKTIFVSNAGSDAGLFPETYSTSSVLSEPFSGDPGRTYTEFYSALKATGEFTLVSDPTLADLVLEIGLSSPKGPTNPNRQNGASDPLPMFRLVVYDCKSHYVLWTFTSSIDSAYIRKTHDRNFDQALSSVLSQFLQIAGKHLGAAPPPATN